MVMTKELIIHMINNELINVIDDIVYTPEEYADDHNELLCVASGVRGAIDFASALKRTIKNYGEAVNENDRNNY